MTTRITFRYTLALLLSGTVASALGAQPIADRVSRAGNGSVRMSFATRPEVCGRGGNIHRGGDWHGNFGSGERSRDVEWDSDCDYGPGRLVLDKRDDALAINEGNLIIEGQDTFVEVETAPQQFEKRAIQTGLSDGINIEVVSGLEAGDKIKHR